MVSKRYQPLEDARAKALQEASLRHEARHSRYGGKYNALKEEHSRVETDRKIPDRVDARDTQSRGSEEHGPRRTSSIEERNNQLRQENFEKRDADYKRRLREKDAEEKRSAARLENMKKNYPDEYKREMKVREKMDAWNRQLKQLGERDDRDKLGERDAKSDNKWSRELSDKGRQTADRARSDGRENLSRDDRTER